MPSNGSGEREGAQRAPRPVKRLLFDIPDDAMLSKR
jgi:hypothetical protein